jgi:hypothetical protein
MGIVAAGTAPEIWMIPFVMQKNAFFPSKSICDRMFLGSENVTQSRPMVVSAILNSGCPILNLFFSAINVFYVYIFKLL